MRYRPIGSSGAAVSTLCLSLGRSHMAQGPAALKDLIFAALEQGINAYHLDCADADLLSAAGQAFSHVERRLLWVSLTLGSGGNFRERQGVFSPQSLRQTLEASLHTSKLGWIDVAVLDEPAENELPLSSLQALKAMRSSGQVRLLGIRGDSAIMDTYLSTGAFDALFTPFSIEADWQIRSRLRAAQRRDMAIFIYDYQGKLELSAARPSTALPGRRSGLFGMMGRKSPIDEAANHPFAFLHTMPSWTAEEICLAVALTEPSVASALVGVFDRQRLEDLAKVPERHLPAGLSAQIEMARVG
ncbi:aldo/keto reductase [Brevundimonas vesicularis]|uniref:aldo/keto reductase n=1 Tax=Brevundimonas vesicularis TaxID=41276 RepID=UPI0038D37AE1